jgi:hypothetical protein
MIIETHPQDLHFPKDTKLDIRTIAKNYGEGPASESSRLYSSLETFVKVVLEASPTHHRFRHPEVGFSKFPSVNQRNCIIEVHD